MHVSYVCVLAVRTVLAAKAVVELECQAAAGACKRDQVQLIDGTCEKSWDRKGLTRANVVVPKGFPHGSAVKPKGGLRKLCKLDPSSLKLLQDFASGLPDAAWQEPFNRFSFGDRPKPKYHHVNLHFVDSVAKAYTGYKIYPVALNNYEWLEPLIGNITAMYNYEELFPLRLGFLRRSVPRLILARLEPKQTQDAHIDSQNSALVPHKLHVPLTDADGRAILEVTLENKTAISYHLQQGYAYEVNNRFLHRALNQGDTARIHLVIEYLPYDVGSVEAAEAAPLTRTELDAKFARMKHQEALASKTLAQGTAMKARPKNGKTGAARDTKPGKSRVEL